MTIIVVMGSDKWARFRCYTHECPLVQARTVWDPLQYIIVYVHYITYVQYTYYTHTLDIRYAHIILPQNIGMLRRSRFP